MVLRREAVTGHHAHVHSLLLLLWPHAKLELKLPQCTVVPNIITVTEHCVVVVAVATCTMNVRVNSHSALLPS